MAETADKAGMALLIPTDVPMSARPDRGREVVHSGEVFGTNWTLHLVRKDSTSPANDEAYLSQMVKACQQALSLVDSQMSLWLDTSDIARFNNLNDGETLELPEPLALVTAEALKICEETGGAFYPGLYDAVERWGFGPSNLADPVASGLAFARQCTGAPPVENLLGGNKLEKRRDFALDLNGIAKGYAVDLLCDLARAHPDTAACLVEIGGEFKAYGTRADGMPFWVDLAPDGDQRKTTYRAALYGWACATSGEAERCHRNGDVTYSHIIDPNTGAGVQTDMIAATVFDKDCARADALATGLIVMGAEKALAFADERSIPCVLTLRDKSADVLSCAMREWT